MIRRQPVRRPIRFIADVLTVGGILLLADAAVTVLWQEPLSAATASRAQSDLERRFDRTVVEADRATRAQTRDPRADAERRRRQLGTGDPVARLEMPTLGRRYVIVEGTDTLTLRKGPAHYPETALPGEGRTVAIAGHRTTYMAPFRTIDRLTNGDRLTLTLPYGRFTYRVQGRRIVRPDARWVIRDVGYDRLVLTACHPLYSASRRIVVFARLVDGAGTGAAEATELPSRDSRKVRKPYTSAPAARTTSSQ